MGCTALAVCRYETVSSGAPVRLQEWLFSSIEKKVDKGKDVKGEKSGSTIFVLMFVNIL
jgi:hypothetical protein